MPGELTDNHSVQTKVEMCVGCTDCIKRCPTEAIRVRGGKARINGARCIDCGLCVSVCKHGAKQADTTPLSEINDYKYKIALPAPALYGQFSKISDVNVILTALKSIGFDDVFEVALAAEYVTAQTRRYMSAANVKRPLISSACPAVIRLISMRFPSLISHILPIIPPVEAAAQMARAVAGKSGALKERGIGPDEAGVFFISPCAAKRTYTLRPLGIDNSGIDGVISMQDVYRPMLSAFMKLKEPEALAASSRFGLRWAASGGETRGVEVERAISVDGMDNVIMVLEQVEDGVINDVDFIEALACMGGCVGGPLTVINGYVAKSQLMRAERFVTNLDESKKRAFDIDEEKINFPFTKEIEPLGVMKLDADVSEALKKMEAMNSLYARLPKIDCGSCGAPSCKAFSEDVARSDAVEEDCVFLLRRRVKELAEMTLNLAEKLPQTSAR